MRKKGSSSSTDGFAGTRTDDKLICIFEQLNKKFDKITELESQQVLYREEVKMVSEGYIHMKKRMNKIEELWNRK